MTLIYFLLIGLVAGWLAGQIMKGGSFGLIGNLVVGVLGAILGGFVFVELGLPLPAGLPVPSFAPRSGRCCFFFLLTLINKKR